MSSFFRDDAQGQQTLTKSLQLEPRTTSFTRGHIPGATLSDDPGTTRVSGGKNERMMNIYQATRVQYATTQHNIRSGASATVREREEK